MRLNWYYLKANWFDQIEVINHHNLETLELSAAGKFTSNLEVLRGFDAFLAEDDLAKIERYKKKRQNRRFSLRSNFFQRQFSGISAGIGQEFSMKHCSEESSLFLFSSEALGSYQREPSRALLEAL